MRLIDADNLKPTEGIFIYQTEDKDTVVAVEAYRWELIEREAPTVKAIPLEYVRKNFANSNFEQTFLLVLHMMEAEENEKQTVE